MRKLSVEYAERDDKKTTDERYVIELVKSVRENGNVQAFSELKKYLDSYIRMFSNKYRIPGCDADEIEQECLCALWSKAIEDFEPSRGKFKSFAILCIKRHLFSLIKGNNQQKRLPLNQSISLSEDRSTEDGENLSLLGLIVQDDLTADEALAINESCNLQLQRLMAKLSKLEQEVWKLYIQRCHYDEIVVELRKIFPRKKCNKKAVDNALCRVKKKIQVSVE